MSTDRASQLNINVGKRVRYYIIYFSILVLLLIWGNDIFILITSSLATDPQKSEWAQKLIASLITALGAGAFLIVNLGRDINLHSLIDNSFFHVRHNTNIIIQREMINCAQEINAPGWKKMSRNPTEVRRLFYHFANQQETLRALAFTYWEQYFVNIYIIFFGTLFFLISLIWSLLRWEFDTLAFAPLVFLFIVTIVGVSTRYTLLPKIYDLPVQQIREIFSSNSSELKKQVKTRFG